MDPVDKKPHIAIAMSYHNNLYDTVRALSTRMQVTFLSPRPISHHIYLLNDLSIQSGIEGISDLLRHIPKSTNYVLIKHLHRPRNFTPFLVALLRRARVIIMIQRAPALSPALTAITMRILSFIFLFTRTQVFAVTKEGWEMTRLYFPQSQYIPACIDTKRFNARERQSKDTSKTLRLLCIAKYQPRKNIAYLLKALRTLTQTYPDLTFQLEVIGGVVDPAEYERTKQLVETLGLTSLVTLRKMIPAVAMPEHIAKADLFILPASREQLGYAALEAMASGLPVLISSDTGAASYVEHEKSGYIFEPRSVNEIVSAITSFITPSNTINWAKIRTFGKRSLSIVEAEHSPDHFIQRFQTLLR